MAALVCALLARPQWVPWYPLSATRSPCSQRQLDCGRQARYCDGVGRRVPRGHGDVPLPVRSLLQWHARRACSHGAAISSRSSTPCQPFNHGRWRDAEVTVDSTSFISSHAYGQVRSRCKLATGAGATARPVRVAPGSVIVSRGCCLGDGLTPARRHWLGAHVQPLSPAL